MTEEERSSEGTDEERGPELLKKLEEFRARLIKCIAAALIGFLACYSISDRIFSLLIRPLVTALPKGGHLSMLRLAEGFITYMKLSAFAGAFLASPVIFYQTWRLVSPYLPQHTKRYVWPVTIVATIFFLSGAALAYFVVFPFGFKVFLEYGGAAVQADLSMDDYLGISMRLLFAFGLIFELPVAVFFLARLGVLTHRTLARGRGYALVLSFFLGAVLTTPEVLTQLMMAIPLYALYEVSILVARIFGPEPEEDGEEGRNEAESTGEG